MQQILIDTERLQRDLETLATFVEPNTPGWTRRAFSEAFVAGRTWLATTMNEAGLTARVDAAGNLIGRRAGAEDLPPIVIGSHTDTVLGGGRFDGPLGVLAGIAVARALKREGVTLRHPLEVVDFLAEEVTPLGCVIGSSGMVGLLDDAELMRSDASGRTLAHALQAVGGTPAELQGAIRRPGDVAAYLELHIEQGRVLEQVGAAIGVVQGIVGIRRATLHLTGRPDHAGTTPMDLRYDALAAAAEVVLAVERAGRTTDGAVATVGTLAIWPNQGNVVPGAVQLSFEIRSLDWATVERLWNAILATARDICTTRGITLTSDDVHDTAPMVTPDWLIELIAAAAPGAPQLPSGAGHDASLIGRIAPAGMIFVRSRDGRSHCPEEYSTPEDIAAGVQALAQAVVSIDSRTENSEW